MKLEEVNMLINTVKKNEISYKGKFKQLVKKIARLTKNEVRGPDKDKTFTDHQTAPSPYS